MVLANNIYVSFVDICELVRLLAKYHGYTSKSVIEVFISSSQGGTLAFEGKNVMAGRITNLYFVT
jgi:hypothetical protein